LLPNGESYLRQYGARIIEGRGIQKRLVKMLEDARLNAINVMALLKKEYGLQDP
jgi:hypothetical protein